MTMDSTVITFLVNQLESFFPAKNTLLESLKESIQNKSESLNVYQ